jgi:hypothetical protein
MIKIFNSIFLGNFRIPKFFNVLLSPGITIRCEAIGTKDEENDDAKISAEKFGRLTLFQLDTEYSLRLFFLMQINLV